MKIYILILMLFVIPLVSAQLIFQESEDVNLKIPCINNNTLCSATADCNLTIVYPNSSVLVSEGIMTNDGGFFNYTLNENQTTPTGEYQVTMYCLDSGINGYSTFNYKITVNGEEITTAKAVFYIGLLAVLVFFFAISIYLFVAYETLLSRVATIGIAYVLLTAISFIGWQMARDFLTSSPFLIAMLRIIFFVLIAGAFPLLMIGFAWYFLLLFKIKEIQRLMDKGFSEQDAQRRISKK